MKTCVVSAPVQIDLSVLRRVLHDLGYRVLFPFEFSLGVDIQSALSKAIDEADLCVFVLADEHNNSNVLFEIGYAKGLRKKILIIREGSKTEVPYLQGFATISSNLGDEQALARSLGPAIRQIKPAGRIKATAAHSTRETAGRDKSVEDIFSRLRTQELLTHGNELEATILDALRRAGVQVTFEAYKHKRSQGHPVREYDAAVWVDGLQGRIANPLLVEIRKKIDVAKAKEIRDQFFRNVEVNQGGALIVLYVEGPEKRIAKCNSIAPLVFYFRVETLLGALKEASLAEILWRERNHLAHGV